MADTKPVMTLQPFDPVIKPVMTLRALDTKISSIRGQGTVSRQTT